jgi:predicted transcriptional regulator
MENECNRLYRDFTHLNSLYVTWNVDLIPAVIRGYKLTSLDIVLLCDIAMKYDSERQKPCEYSYGDLARKYEYSTNSIKESLRVLLEHKLIERLNNRKGRVSYSYIPNVKLLQSILGDYITKRDNSRERPPRERWTDNVSPQERITERDNSRERRTNNVSSQEHITERKRPPRERILQ